MNLLKHQQEASILAMSRNLALFHDCGCGKTLTALCVAEDYLKVAVDPLLVVCTKKLINNAWIADANEFKPDMDIVALWADSREKRKKILYGDHQVFVTNYDTLRNNFDLIQDRKFGMMVLDESAKTKDPNSQITQAVLALSGFRSKKDRFKTKNIIPRRYALTGLAAPNAPSEYWAQIKFVTGPGNEVFSDSFCAFRARFFYSIDIGNRMKMWKFRMKTFEEFCQLMSPVIHIARADILGLKPQKHTIHQVELSRKEQAAYDSMKKDFVVEMGNESVISRTILVEIMKLRQLACGFVYGGEGTHRIGSSKFDYMKQLLKKDGDEQSLIWVNFRAEAQQLTSIPNSEVLNDKQSDQQIQAFKQGKMQYLILNPASGGHGLTFVNTHHSRYSSSSYSFELMLQSRKRIDRIGQSEACVYDYLNAKGTVDNVISKTVSRKEKMVNDFLDYLTSVQKGEKTRPSNGSDVFKESFAQMLRKETSKWLKGN